MTNSTPEKRQETLQKFQKWFRNNKLTELRKFLEDSFSRWVKMVGMDSILENLICYNANHYFNISTADLAELQYEEIRERLIKDHLVGYMNQIYYFEMCKLVAKTFKTEEDLKDKYQTIDTITINDILKFVINSQKESIAFYSELANETTDEQFQKDY